MFEPRFLGRVRVLGQATPGGSAPGPAPSFPAAAPSAPSPFDDSDLQFDPNIAYGYAPSYGPPPGSFMVAANPGESYPANYPPDQYQCTLTPDGMNWLCIPLGLAAQMPASYPVVPFGASY